VQRNPAVRVGGRLETGPSNPFWKQALTLNIATISLRRIDNGMSTKATAAPDFQTHGDQIVFVIAVPALGAIQFTLILYLAPSIANVLVRPMIADLAVV
jgi:hypothetical protein